MKYVVKNPSSTSLELYILKFNILKPIKLNEIVLNTFIKNSDLKLPKLFKKKLINCITNEREIEIIEDEYEEITDKKDKKKQVKKEKILDETQFYK